MKNNKIRKILSQVNLLINNSKLESLTVIIATLIFLCAYWFKEMAIIQTKFTNLVDYFTQDRLNGITAFFAITVGIYITVITILGTSRLGISKKMITSNLDKPLISVIMLGMLENLITSGMAIFINLNTKTAYILMVFLIISIISFVKFIIILLMIFKVNMNEMAKEIDNEERYNDEILASLKEIVQFMKINK